MSNTGEFKVVILGGGLVGALAALTFARRGFAVELYEKRPGFRFLSDRYSSGNNKRWKVDKSGIIS